MLVNVKMKDGTMYKGIKCGIDNGFVFLANAWELTEDDREDLMPGEYMQSPAGKDIYTGGGEKIRLIQLPVADIKIIESEED